MPIHLSRRRLIAGSLAGAGLAAVPVLGASEAVATSVCVMPPEAGLWRNDEAAALNRRYNVSRLQLRFVCGSPAPKSRDPGEWYMTVWLTGNPLGGGIGGDFEWDHTTGEVRARRFANSRRITARFDDRDASFLITVGLVGAGTACPERLLSTLTPLRFGRVRGSGSFITNTLRRPACLDKWKAMRKSA